MDMSRPRTRRSSFRLTLCLDAKDAEALLRMAETQGRSEPEVLRLLIREAAARASMEKRDGVLDAAATEAEARGQQVKAIWFRAAARLVRETARREGVTA